jgi:anti-sigma factor RsiW
MGVAARKTTGLLVFFMDRKGLISQLQSSAGRPAVRTPFCPDDHEIAGYVDGRLDGDARELIDRHLADCQACVSRVGLLTRLIRERAGERVSQAGQTRSRKWLRSAPRWAAAASLVLALGYLAGTSDLLSGPGEETQYQATRNLESAFSVPEILAPATGVMGPRDGFVIRWTEVPGSLYYEVRIVTDAGDLVRQQRVQASEWTLDPGLDLEAGRDYFIRVDAYLTDAKAIHSEHIPFRIRE